MKRLINIFLICTVLSTSACAILPHDGVCGHPDEAPSSKTTVVKLKLYTKEPSFYYQSELFVVFIAPKDMENYLNKFTITNTEVPSARLINRIRADLKLETNKDLLQYNFDTWDLGILIESLVVGLTEEGNVSIIAPGGTPVESVTILHNREPLIVNTVVYAGKKGINAMLFDRDCIAD